MLMKSRLLSASFSSFQPLCKKLEREERREVGENEGEREGGSKGERQFAQERV